MSKKWAPVFLTGLHSDTAKPNAMGLPLEKSPFWRLTAIREPGMSQSTGEDGRKQAKDWESAALGRIG
jgi:hypothetical protein